MKKVLAIVLALMLVFSATAALAAEYEIVSIYIDVLKNRKTA